MISSPEKYLLRHKHFETLHHANFSSAVSSSSWANRPSSTPYSKTPSTFALPIMQQDKPT
jgi:hypothetical protein